MGRAGNPSSFFSTYDRVNCFYLRFLYGTKRYSLAGFFSCCVEMGTSIYHFSTIRLRKSKGENSGVMEEFFFCLVTYDGRMLCIMVYVCLMVSLCDWKGTTSTGPRGEDFQRSPIFPTVQGNLTYDTPLAANFALGQ